MQNRTDRCWPVHEQDELDVALRVLQSGKTNYWTGEEGRLFEKEFAEYVGANYAVALHNGTLALELALLTLGIGAGDEVVTTPRTFIASVSAIVARGAVPVFADIDLDSQMITADSISAVITEKTKAIIVVHLAGRPAEMDPIMDLAKHHSLRVIEDCAQAHGARYKGRSVGSIGDIGAWSFCQDKIVSTGGEGGMLTLNDETLWRKAWAYKDHGKSYEAVYEREHPIGFKWLHDSFGSNWRMLEIQAAIGRVQLKKLDDWVEIRRRNAKLLDDILSTSTDIRIPNVPSHLKHSYYRYYVFLADEIMEYQLPLLTTLGKRGVFASVGSCSEVYLERAFDNTSFRPPKRLPNAQKAGMSSLMFLVDHLREKDELIEVGETVLQELLGLKR